MESVAGPVMGILALLVSGVFALLQRQQTARQSLYLQRLKARLAKSETIAKRRAGRLTIALAELAALRVTVESTKKQVVEDLTNQIRIQAESLAELQKQCVELHKAALTSEQEPPRPAGRSARRGGR